ncbi:uncharacterized protein N0V89_010384 [Didymosphaeria variabile]|uniref:MYND-type domain-containing protein n=1 Tax=Didymosphaeria variabile TaxID=1932322 RepID=A0A9W8XB72_9PLEO|nr:uncharacterized protein N0V89_010384 [Didymosphaeria variabile]KAJ4346455.1 hypothetical protein N0V89_010384 [Didymosphaeria variabile]
MGAWGHDLFQSDHDLDMVSEMTHDAGLYKLEEEAIAKAKAAGESDAEKQIYYNLYGPSHPDVVRHHLDSGVLVDLIEKKKAKMLAPPNRLDFLRDPCYEYVLLGACAMGLGCTLPSDYLNMLKKVYTEGGLMSGALMQMRKALFGPDGFTNGVPYDFESKDLIETANSMHDEDRQPGASGFVSLNVIGPGGFFNTGMGDSSTSTIIKELRAQHAKPDACGGCGVKAQQSGAALLQCAKCKNRRYCSSTCQKKHWKVHKRVCDPTLY